MSFILPYDIIVKIIDTVGEDKVSKTSSGSRNLLLFLILSTRFVANIYLPPSESTTPIPSAPVYFQRNHSSIYLTADQMLSCISANSRMT